jgi:LmbE family N-acetylglucosaminyl deacetylase
VDGLVLSPHLDDAVFSVQGVLRAAAARGERVAVATAFTDCEDGEARRAEDRTALALLGAAVVHWGLRDAPLRSPAYRSFRGLCTGTDATDGQARRALLDRWIETIHVSTPRWVLAPLGVGGHIDHRLAHEAALEAARQMGQRGPQLAFYEDLPYAWVDGAAALRLGQGGPVTAARWLRDLGRAPYVRRYLTGRDLPHLPALARLATEPVALRWTPEVRSLALDAEAAWGPVAAYGSQWPDWVASRGAWARLTALHSARLGQPGRWAERLWVP